MDYKAIRQDLMKPHKINALAICVIQIACVVGWRIWAPISHFSSIHPAVVLTFPSLLAAIISFLFSLFLPIKSNLCEALLLSTPAILVYFYFYILIFIWADKHVLAEVIPFFFLYLIPTVAGVFLLNGLAVWLGSWIHHKLFKQKDGPSD